MSELDHKKFEHNVPKIVKRQVVLNETEKYISDNWGLLEKPEKEMFVKKLGTAFDYILSKIDARKKNE